MLTIKYQTSFKKDYKRIKKRGYNINLLQEVIELLATKKRTACQISRAFFDWQLCGLQGMSHHTGLVAYLRNQQRRIDFIFNTNQYT